MAVGSLAVGVSWFSLNTLPFEIPVVEEEILREVTIAMAAIQRTSWALEIQRCLSSSGSGDPTVKWLQLATVSTDSTIPRPKNRTIVFRGFADNFGLTNQRNSLTFITDMRSNKVNEMATTAFAEACWYFSKPREQFRIAGTLQLVSPDEADEKLANARRAIWKQISDNARAQFSWPGPGEPRPEDAEDEDFGGQGVSANDPIPDTFALLLLHPDQIDHLILKGFPQRRYIYKLSHGADMWEDYRVNP